MSTQSVQTSAGRKQLCGYPVQSWLAAGRTALCVAEGGRLLVLQRLPEECLQGVTLHPSVRERLMRVKELAHRQVASFVGVERDHGGDAWLVWEYLDGEALQAYLADPTRSPRQVLLMLRELILAVEGLHALGIIHGALHPLNVFIGHTGELKLTHISPLLHHQADVDYDALAQLLQQALSGRDDAQTRRSRLIAQKIAQRTPMLELAGEISRLVEAREDDVAPPVENLSVERRFRRKAIYSAAGCAGAAVVIVLAGYLLLRGGGDAPQRSPEAPSELLQPK